MTALTIAEFRKVTSLRFWWLLALTPVLAAALSGALFATLAPAENRGTLALTAGTASLSVYLSIGATAAFAAVFGAVAAGTEFAHRTITTTMITAPNRDLVVAAKLLVAAAVGLGYAAAVAVVGLLLLSALARNNFQANLGLVGSVSAGSFAVLCWALVGTGLALAVRSWPIALAVLGGWCLLVEPAFVVVGWGLDADGLTAWLPVSATAGVVGAGLFQQPTLVFNWPGALLWLMVWTVAAVGAGWWRTRSHDLA